MENSTPPRTLVVLMDGTFASLTEGRGSSIARIHGMLSGDMGPPGGQVLLHYAPGQQWAAWRTVPELVSGASLDCNIRAAYGWLAGSKRMTGLAVTPLSSIWMMPHLPIDPKGRRFLDR